MKRHDPPLILIADDQRATTIMLERVFEYEGYQVHSVYDGLAAVEAAQSMRPDLILLDINMPEMNGFDVLRYLRETPAISHIPTILITAMNELEGVVQGLSLGADDYLRKPFHPQELLARAQSKLRARELEEALHRRTRELEALLRVSEELSQHLRVDELLDFVLFLVDDLLPGFMTAIYYVNEEGEVTDHRFVIKPEDRDDLAHQLIQADTLRRMLQSFHGFIWPDGDSPIIPDVPCGIYVPLIHDDLIRGAVVVGAEEPYDMNHFQLLQGIGRQVVLSLRNAELYDIQAQYANHLEDMVQERTAELESAQKMLIRSEKLASVGRLAASIAHEIKNPLLPIRLDLERIKEDVEAQQIPDLEDVRHSLESVDRIKHTVDRLRGFTGNQQDDVADFHRLDINQVINNVIGLNQKMFEHDNLKLTFDLSPVPQMLGNNYQLEYVFMNLLLNAHDAMQDGDSIHIASHADAKGIYINVCDTGSGIPEDLVDAVFEPFVSTKDDGNGLGLFISYGIVEKHNGTIHIDSTVGKGTCFTIWFPPGR